jgi:hypothetical protein
MLSNINTNINLYLIFLKNYYYDSNHTLPCVNTVKKGVEIYNLWTSQKEIEELQEKYYFGFLGIGIHKI